MPNNLLEQFYLPSGIFVSNPNFSDDKPEMSITCRVPSGSHYTTVKVPYVTAEEYVRILSQSSILLAHRILQNGLAETDISADEFLQVLGAPAIYYRNLAMTFHKLTSRGKTFEMELSLVDFRVIKRGRGFVLLTFRNERTVISGEMRFVWKPLQ